MPAHKSPKMDGLGHALEVDNLKMLIQESLAQVTQNLAQEQAEKLRATTLEHQKEMQAVRKELDDLRCERVAPDNEKNGAVAISADTKSEIDKNQELQEMIKNILNIRDTESSLEQAPKNPLPIMQ